MTPISLQFARCAFAALTVLVWAGAPAWAQDEAAAPSVWPKLLTRTRFSGAGEFIKSSEQDRPLDVVLAGDLHIMDLGPVLFPADFTFAAAFNDKLYPHFVDYSFSLGPAVRVGAAQVGLVFHHTSRHLHDEPRPESVAWNQAGVRVARALRRDRWRFSGSVTASRYLAWSRHYVDYDWEVAGAGRASFDLSRRTAYYIDGAVRGLRCNPVVAGRTGELGARLEGGIDLAFRGGHLEAYAAWDRRIDPSPFSRRVADFFVLGARVTGSR